MAEKFKPERVKVEYTAEQKESFANGAKAGRKQEARRQKARRAESIGRLFMR